METAVITTGGLGTREATITKSNPKTMLPVYTNSNYDTDPVLKPIIELIFVWPLFIIILLDIACIISKIFKRSFNID